MTKALVCVSKVCFGVRNLFRRKHSKPSRGHVRWTRFKAMILGRKGSYAKLTLPSFRKFFPLSIGPSKSSFFCDGECVGTDKNGRETWGLVLTGLRSQHLRCFAHAAMACAPSLWFGVVLPFASRARDAECVLLRFRRRSPQGLLRSDDESDTRQYQRAKL